MNTPLELSVDKQRAPGRTDVSRKNVDAKSRLLLGANKIQPQHYERLAMVYVRQSSPQQVVDHRESGELQYKLADRAVDLGWSRERVVVIDDDQAQTASTMEGRLGFQRLLAEVSLDHVGLVLGMEGYGASGPAGELADKYGFNGPAVVSRIKEANLV